MAFDFSTLITDRTLNDVTTRTDKGFYNATDLNQVSAALEDLVTRLRDYGYAVPGYQRIKIDRKATPISRLPEGYTELEYIQSSGTQYVDTGIKPNQNTRVLMDARLDQGSACYLYGCRGDNAAGYNNRFGIMYTGTFFRSDFGVGNGLTFPSTIRTSVRYQMDKNKQTCTIGDASVVNTDVSFQSDLPMYFFCVREGPDAKYFASLTLYSCNIYDDGVLVRNYQPCINASGEIGLYDLVSNQFYGNNGTGSFIAGAVVPPELKPDERDSYTWYEDDIPTAGQMETYRQNIVTLRRQIAVMQSTPETPETIRQLDYIRANNIEQILMDLDFLISNITKSWDFSGELYAGEA